MCLACWRATWWSVFICSDTFMVAIRRRGHVSSVSRMTLSKTSSPSSLLTQAAVVGNSSKVSPRVLRKYSGDVLYAVNMILGMLRNALSVAISNPLISLSSLSSTNLRSRIARSTPIFRRICRVSWGSAAILTSYPALDKTAAHTSRNSASLSANKSTHSS